MQYCTLRRHRFEPRVSVVFTSAYNMCVSMNEAAAMMPPSLGQILNLVTYRGCTLARERYFEQTNLGVRYTRAVGTQHAETKQSYFAQLYSPTGINA